MIPMSTPGEVDYAMLRRDGHGYHELGTFSASQSGAPPKRRGRLRPPSDGGSGSWYQPRTVPTSWRTPRSKMRSSWSSTKTRSTPLEPSARIGASRSFYWR